MLKFLKDSRLNREEDRKKVVFITGAGKSGVDKLFHDWVREHDYHWAEFYPNWKDIEVEGAIVRYRDGKPYNSVAGFWRDEEMAEVCTHGVSFYDGVSSGTRDMIDRVTEKGSPCAMYLVTVEINEDKHAKEQKGGGSRYSSAY
jgi:hypothetical protein